MDLQWRKGIFHYEFHAHDQPHHQLSVRLQRQQPQHQPLRRPPPTLWLQLETDMAAA
jgi:hypothetical protein